VSRNAGALLVDRAQPVGDPERSELDPVGAEGVRFDDVGTGPHVFLMHFRHEIGLGDVERIEALVDEDTFGVQHRAHCSVAYEHTFVQRLQELLLHVSTRSVLKVSALIRRYDFVTTSRPIERTPCLTESVNS
jgi:hypothetical protein